MEFLTDIFPYTKNENFILSKECFKIIFSLVENEDINKEIVANFLEENAKEFSSLILNSVGAHINDITEDEYYFMKRECLILSEKLLIDPTFEKFNTIYTNDVENLKVIMTQLNNKSKKIMAQAIDVLYFFFLDIENKHQKIKNILHNNKQNFYKFFEKLEETLSSDVEINKNNPELSEKKNFILYELERLENFMD
jgi:hypothetical protein